MVHLLFVMVMMSFGHLFVSTSGGGRCSYCGGQYCLLLVLIVQWVRARLVSCSGNGAKLDVSIPNNGKMVP